MGVSVFFFFKLVIVLLPGKASSTLQKADINLISRSTCSSASVYSTHITQRMICAGNLKGGVDACQVINQFQLWFQTAWTVASYFPLKKNHYKTKTCVVLNPRATVEALWCTTTLLVGIWSERWAGVSAVQTQTGPVFTPTWTTCWTGSIQSSRYCTQYRYLYSIQYVSSVSSTEVEILYMYFFLKRKLNSFSWRIENWNIYNLPSSFLLSLSRKTLDVNCDQRHHKTPVQWTSDWNWKTMVLFQSGCF